MWHEELISGPFLPQALQVPQNLGHRVCSVTSSCTSRFFGLALLSAFLSMYNKNSALFLDSHPYVQTLWLAPGTLTNCTIANDKLATLLLCAIF